jgi:NMD protein affecting ribosome stability and mRNA decay
MMSDIHKDIKTFWEKKKNAICNKCGQENFISWDGLSEAMCQKCFIITMKKLGVGFFEPIEE